MIDIVVIKLHSLIDVITNSSSELFICKTKKSILEVKEILESLLLVYNEASEYSYEYDSVFGEIHIAERDGHDIYGYGNDISKGDLTIYSAEDNSIPSGMWEMMEDMFDAVRHHIG